MTEHVDELLGLYALGGLEPDELRRVEAHLAECPACRREADSLRALSGWVAQGVREAEPPPRTRARILERIRATHEPAPPPARPAGMRPAPAWMPLALATAMILGLFGWNLSLNSQLSDLRQQVATQQYTMTLLTGPKTHVVDLAGQGQLATASGRAWYNETTHEVVLVTWKLFPLEPNQTYQVWLIGEKGPVSAGVFGVNVNGWSMNTLDVPEELAHFSGIGVSREPAGGSETPTEVVLTGGL